MTWNHQLSNYEPLYNPYLCYWKRWSLGLYPMETLYKQLETPKQWLHKGIFVATESFTAPCLLFLFSDVGVSFRCCLSTLQSSTQGYSRSEFIELRNWDAIYVSIYHLSLVWLKRNISVSRSIKPLQLSCRCWTSRTPVEQLAWPSQARCCPSMLLYRMARCGAECIWGILGD